MKKENAIRYYRKFSAADAYIIGFTYRKQTYLAEVKEIPPRYMKVERESTSNGGGEKLQLRLNNKAMEELIRKGACPIEFTPNGNKGVEFEREVYRLNGQTPRPKDNIGFWVSGDITLDGKEVQVKFNGAQIVTFSTLHNLQKAGKDFRSYVPKVGRKRG